MDTVSSFLLVSLQTKHWKCLKIKCYLRLRLHEVTVVTTVPQSYFKYETTLTIDRNHFVYLCSGVLIIFLI